MLERGLWDSLDFYPFALWPIFYSALTAVLYKFNSGIFLEEGRKFDEVYHGAAGKVFYYITFPLTYFADIILILYSFLIFGWLYLLSFPLIMMLLLPITWIFGPMPFAQYVMPSAAVFVLMMNAVLFGFIFIKPIADLNSTIFNILT